MYSDDVREDLNLREKGDVARAYIKAFGGVMCNESCRTLLQKIVVLKSLIFTPLLQL